MQSEGHVQMQSASLEDVVDLEVELIEFSTPVMLAASVGDWMRNWTILPDSEPPSIVISRSTDSENAIAPLVSLLIEFSEPVFPVRGDERLDCRASLQPLGATDYGILDMVYDSVRYCGENLSQRSFEPVIQVLGAESHHLERIRSEGPTRLLLTLVPFHPEDTNVSVIIDRGAISDYAGNLNQAPSQFILADRSGSGSWKHDAQASLKQREVYWTEPCYITGVIFLCIGLSTIVITLGIVVCSCASKWVKRWCRFQN